MTDLDTILRDALTADAERAPELPTEWVGPTTATIVPIAEPRRGHRILVAVGGVAAAAAAIGGLALVARPDDPQAPAATNAPPATTSPITAPPATAPLAWQPAGTEYPLTDLGPIEQSPHSPVAAAVSRRIGVPDHPDLTVYAELSYQGGTTATASRCVGEESGGSGCTPDWNPIEWSLMITSSVDNRVADHDLWVVDGLSADIAVVSYADGDLSLWAQPVAGVVAFPDVAGPDEVVVGYDAVGREVARFGPAELAAQQELAASAQPTPMADVSQDQFVELGELTRSTLRACLEERGGAESDGVFTFDPAVDPTTAWDGCVAEVKAIVADAVTALGVRVYDPATERAQNPDTPFTYSGG